MVLSEEFDDFGLPLIILLDGQTKSLLIFQDISRINPPCVDDVCAISAFIIRRYSKTPLCTGGFELNGNL